ncbi:MAG TPA: DNA polymerase ligase N-terminal domain-containing protein [Thermoanaerobaculia bacterium]|nr:DNA polymerase ligase N-terminal domain-containing protein [Thermoanaerobaculia bacterium]
MPDLLKKYRQMRDFGETPEPSGGKPKKRRLPIFVIQKHRASHLHYDFRLEMEGVLKSWAVPKGPSYDPAARRLAMMTEDHPYDYASFEGVIPAGNYGAGNVIIWDEGEWEFIEPGDDPVAALKSGKLTFRMYGKKMFGEWALVKIGGRSKKSSDKGNEWLLLKHRDQFANPDVDVTVVAPRSVVSNKLVEEMGEDENIWVSNRKAGGRKAPTLADKLTNVGRASARPKRRAEARPTSKKASSSKRAPSPKASARSRSSRPAAKSPARTTARRRPR